MAGPTNIQARYVETTTYRGLSATYTWTLTYSKSTYSYSYPTYTYRTTWYNYYDYSRIWIAIGIVLCLLLFSIIVLASVFYQRQQKRKAWYGQTAAHYLNGGLPPWETAPVGVGDGSVKSPLVSPTQGAYPENPTQVGVYGNLPTVPYSNPTGVTGYTSAGYDIGDSIPPTPAQFSPLSSPTYGAPVPQGTPAIATPSDSPPKAPEYVEASGTAQAPAYTGDPESANRYSKERK